MRMWAPGLQSGEKQMSVVYTPRSMVVCRGSPSCSHQCRKGFLSPAGPNLNVPRFLEQSCARPFFRGSPSPTNPSLSASPSPCAHLVSAEGCAPQGPTSRQKAGRAPAGLMSRLPSLGVAALRGLRCSLEAVVYTLCFRDCLHEAKSLLPHLSGAKRESRGPSQNLESLGDGA